MNGGETRQPQSGGLSGLVRQPRSSMECRQSAAWTTNWSFLVASCVKDFPGRAINSGSTIPTAARLTVVVLSGVVIFFTYLSGNAPALSDMRPTPPAFVPQTYQPPPPSWPTTAVTNYSHAPTVTDLSAFHAQLWRL